MKSHQGEPLLAIAALASLPEEHISTPCLSLGPESDAPGSDLPFLGKATLKLNAARNAVEIRTSEPISVPTLSLVLRVRCAGAPLYARHFVALIPPAVVKAPASGPAVTRTTRRGFHLRVARGDTVAGIAAVLLPGQRALQQDLVRQVVAANPDAFPGALDRHVPAGAVLWFPDLAALRQSLLSHAHIPSSSAAPVPVPVRDDVASRARSPALRPAVRSRTQPVAPPPQSSPAASPAGLEEKTRGLESGVNAMRSQCESLDNHLRRIEQSMEALQTAVTAAAARSPPAAQCLPIAPVPKPQIRTVVVTEPIPWTVWLGLPAFGMALAGVLFALWRTGVLMRRRAAETVDPHAPTRPQPASTPVPTQKRTPDRAFDTPAADASPTADVNLGADSIASRAGLSEDIIREMERAINETRSIFSDVDRLIGLGRMESAVSILEFQIKQNPKDRESWIKLMAVYRRAGMEVEFDKAAAAFKKNFPDGRTS